MKILNLYCGIGGNRKLWGNEHQITAVEFDPRIAAIYQALYPNAVMPTNNNILDTKLGFKRGNLFNNLYDEYKNYKPQELKANNEKEDLLLQIDEQRFAMIEMNLYLDLYPNNKEALNRFNTYLKKEKELVTLYESKYGPLTTSSPVQTNNWTWNNSPWPWEVQS